MDWGKWLKKTGIGLAITAAVFLAPKVVEIVPADAWWGSLVIAGINSLLNYIKNKDK